MRKSDGIDIMKLFTLGSGNGWNEFLNKCLRKMDINSLARVKYELQVGMTDLEKQKLNTEEINILFLRWCKSLDDTAKKIIKIKYPMPGDSITNVELNLHTKKEQSKMLEAKRLRDKALNSYLHKSSF